MGLYYLVLLQNSKMKGSNWDVLTLDRETYEELCEAVELSHSTLEIEDRVEGVNYIECIGDNVSKEEAWFIAQRYADSHLLTQILELPYIEYI